MSTALQIHDPDVRSQEVTLSGGEPTFDGMFRLAEALVPTGFLPKHIKTPGQCVAIILTGRELGMAPMRALRSLQMVEGKVLENADSQLARFKTDGGRATFRALTEREAVLWLRHPNGDEHEERFTIEDAKAAQVAGKDNWKKYPKAMLRSRVITAGLKSIGWEGGTGGYDPDEITVPNAAPTGAPPREERDVTPRTLEWAKAFPLPWKKNKQYGQPIGGFSRGHLSQISEWLEQKMDAGEDVAQESQDLYDAAAMILAEMDRLGVDKLNGESKSVTMPQAGAVAGALTPNEPQAA